ncbi:MAG TPA: hypothetical protein VFX12_08010 [Vicinamibacterales bacterium]|nr:hypothetical protein [Vicinamibacterales bacterium]
MKRFISGALALPLAAILAVPAIADVKTQDRTQVKLAGVLGRVAGMFSRKAGGEGIEQTVAVKGDRKATFNDSTGKIVDLREEKVYDLDMKKKTYTVTTFDQLRQKMREEEQRAEKEAQKEQPEKEKPEQPTEPQVEVDYAVKDTGQHKQVAGYDTHEAVVTITVRQKGQTLEDGGGLVMTADSWLAPEIPQMKEMMDFDMRYWRQLQGPEVAALTAQQMAQVTAMYPMVKSAMARMQSENAKMQGTPLATTTTFESVKSKEERAQGDDSSSGGGLGGMLARRMKKKDQSADTGRSTIFTTDHEILSVATTVAPSDVAIPAGFTEKQ